jgi:hypothetical protein
MEARRKAREDHTLAIAKRMEARRKAREDHALAIAKRMEARRKACLPSTQDLRTKRAVLVLSHATQSG